MRLDKFLSNATDHSRAQVKRLIKAKQVRVNGEVTKDTAHKVSDDCEVTLFGNVIGTPTPRYFMLNKPQGYVSVTQDSEHPTAIDLLVDECRQGELQIAGRLDLDTTGLLLVTDDGKWNHALTSPKRDCKKTYMATLANPVDEKIAVKFLEGVWLNNEKHRTLPAQLEILEPTKIRLTIAEGRYHQVKRMFGAVENRVLELHRESVGDIVLDPDLEPGDYRPLTEQEIHSILK